MARLALHLPHFERLLRASVPLGKMEYRGHMPSKTLFVLFPGIGDIAEDFERRGFIDDLRRVAVGADAVAVDAHYGYYSSRVIHERITDDVLTAAIEAGYERIWLAGISLGGFGAVSYAARHTAHIAGLVLLAPYLGTSDLINEIAKAGGVGQWEPGQIDEHDYQREVWSWVKQGCMNGDAPVPVFLGYGKRDMFAHANGLLAQCLPAHRVFTVPGGHDWRTWKKIWRLFLGTAKDELKCWPSR